MGDGHSRQCEDRDAIVVRVVLVTLVAADARTPFSTWPVAAEAARCLAADTTWPEARVLAWVLMPGRWSGLVRLGGGVDLSHVVEQAKTRVAARLRESHPQLDGPWTAGFHQHALRRKDDLLRAAHHLLMTPVREGRVERLGDYPYWDAAWL